MIIVQIALTIVFTARLDVSLLNDNAGVVCKDSVNTVGKCSDFEFVNGRLVLDRSERPAAEDGLSVRGRHCNRIE